MEARLVMNRLVWKGLRSMIFRGSSPWRSRWYASQNTNRARPGTAKAKFANLSVLLLWVTTLLRSMCSLILRLMVNTVSSGSRKIFRVVSSGVPSARVLRITKLKQKWLRL